MRHLHDALRGVTRLGFDTPPVIYFVEAHPVYDDRVTAIFEMVSDGRVAGFTSIITLAEVLTLPVRTGDGQLCEEYRDLRLRSDHFTTMPVDAVIAERTAELRARHQLRTPDALQIASALWAGCQAFLTNDDRLRRVTDLDVVVVDDLLL